MSKKKEQFKGWAVTEKGKLLVLTTNRNEARVARKSTGGSVKRVKVEVIV